MDDPPTDTRAQNVRCTVKFLLKAQVRVVRTNLLSEPPGERSK